MNYTVYNRPHSVNDFPAQEADGSFQTSIDYSFSGTYPINGASSAVFYKFNAMPVWAVAKQRYPALNTYDTTPSATGPWFVPFMVLCRSEWSPDRCKTEYDANDYLATGNLAGPGALDLSAADFKKTVVSYNIQMARKILNGTTGHQVFSPAYNGMLQFPLNLNAGIHSMYIMYGVAMFKKSAVASIGEGGCDITACLPTWHWAWVGIGDKIVLKAYTPSKTPYTALWKGVVPTTASAKAAIMANNNTEPVKDLRFKNDTNINQFSTVAVGAKLDVVTSATGGITYKENAATVVGGAKSGWLYATATATGPRSNFSLALLMNVDPIEQATPMNYYFAAFVNKTLYLLNSAGNWEQYTGKDVPAVAALTGAGVSKTILSNLDLTGAPAIDIYAGYARTLAELVQNQRYSKVMTIQ